MGENNIKLVEKALNLLKLNTVRKKLIFYSFAMVLVMGSFNIYSFFTINNITRHYNNILSDLYLYNRISVDFNTINDSMDWILSISPDKAKPDELVSRMNKLASDSREIEGRLNYSGNWVMVSGLRGMLETYSSNGAKALELFKNRKNYLEELEYSRLVSRFINRRINEIVNRHLNQSEILYSEIESRNKSMQVYIAMLILALFIFNTAIILSFSNRISKPIRSLARRAERIAGGDLNVPDVITGTNDEIALLASSFNKMSSNIRSLIHGMIEKAEIERKLKEEEMKNLKVTNMLKETELKVLQSQLNPHFLFNTLNTIARMAMFENADTTLNLIESTSELLRYNLGKLKQGQSVTLRDEIDNVREYIYIQQIRFSDRITFEYDIDDSLLDISVPYLFLQPIVENAIIHGIEPKEGEGRLILRVYKKPGENHVVVEVGDNGMGIAENDLRFILDENESSGIGLYNVEKRLEYYYNDTNLLNIWSKPGEGTVITIRLPAAAKDGEVYVQNADRG